VATDDGVGWWRRGGGGGGGCDEVEGRVSAGVHNKQHLLRRPVPNKTETEPL